MKKKKNPNKRVLGLIFSTANLQVHMRILAVTTPMRSALSLYFLGKLCQVSFENAKISCKFLLNFDSSFVFFSFFLFFSLALLFSFLHLNVLDSDDWSEHGYQENSVVLKHKILAVEHGNYNRACVLSCFSCVQLFVTLQSIALQAPLPMGVSRQASWSGLPCPPPGHLPVLLWQASCLVLTPPGKLIIIPSQLLIGVGDGQGDLACCSSWSRKESDTTE